jgi:hypothetical protein
MMGSIMMPETPLGFYPFEVSAESHLHSNAPHLKQQATCGLEILDQELPGINVVVLDKEQPGNNAG